MRLWFKFFHADRRTRSNLVRFEIFPFGSALHDELRAALPPNAGSVAAVARLHHALGQAFAQAAKAVIGSQRIDFVASHGQTLWHDGAAHVTLQVGDAFADPRGRRRDGLLRFPQRGLCRGRAWRAARGSRGRLASRRSPTKIESR